mmetsp:Transcript_1151/g.2928  ORF Transcript_1151/g.2928 Transcript_1151/m.2928 type:complete len:842 (+) Transcript_1151:96-2621(+)
MAQQKIVGTATLVSLTVLSVTNAFVPIETNSRMAHFTSLRQRRSPLSKRRYSNNGIEDRSKEENSAASESTNSEFSSPLDQTIEFLFQNETVSLNDIALPPVGFNSESLPQSDTPDTTAQTLLAKNAAILASGKDDTIDLGFEINVDSNFVSNTNIGIDSDQADDGIVNEDLKAVLAASEEAVAAAEASIPPELLEVLDELTSETSNDTIFSENANMIRENAATSTGTTPASMASIDHQTDNKPMVNDAFDFGTQPTDDIVDTKVAPISTPSVGKILRFAVPAIGVWLCSPLLSLIDTSAVGVLSGTVQQAALSPAVAVTDYAALLIAFLYTGTTNMVASAQESDRGTVDKPRTAKMMIGAMRMSTYVGVGLGAILFAFAQPLLRAIIGNDAISPAIFAAAMKYVRIRALGMPAAAILGSTQAACLGMQDIKSPLYVLAAAALVNFLGDVFFVGHSNPLIGGTAGAAWATVFSQYAAVAFFVRWLCARPEPKPMTKGPEVMNLSDAILEMTAKSNELHGSGKDRRKRFRRTLENLKLGKRGKNNVGSKPRITPEHNQKSLLAKFSRGARKNVNEKKADADSFSTRGFLRSRFSTIDLLRLPSKETRKEFAPYVIPVTTTQVGRVSGYVAMAHVVASSLGTVSMAAQQVIVSIFYCLCPIADSLSLTAQSFVPAISEKEESPEKAAAMKKVLINFLKAGAVFGGAMMAAVSGIPLLTGFFTSDQAVISLVNSVVPLLLVFFGVHGFVCGSEGMLLGQKDLGYLGKMYAAFFAAVPYVMMGVKRKALAGVESVGLTSVWTVFIGYQLARCVLWLNRTAILQRRTNNAAKEALVFDSKSACSLK